MALTWRNVDAPNFLPATQIGAFGADQINKSLTGASKAIAEFGDANTLAQMAQYNDPAQLQEAIRTGALNLGNASSAAIQKSVLPRAQELLANATTQQTFDQNNRLNPFAVNTAQRNDEMATLKQPILLDEVRRNEQNRIFGEEAAATIQAEQLAGRANTPEAANRLLNDVKNAPRAYVDRLRVGLESKFPGKIGAVLDDPVAISISSAIGAAAGVSPSGSVVSKKPLDAGLQSMLSAAETNAKLPTGLMASVLQQETSGRDTFIADPAKYHYALNAGGKRIAPHTGKESTAFGPYGILESTAKDPGFGVAPLKDKSLPEQTRFASEYLAARIKAAGGDVAKGLADYGEGVQYANNVLDRVPTARELAIGAVGTTAALNLAGTTIDANSAQRYVVASTKPAASVIDVASQLTGEGPLKGYDTPYIVDQLNKVMAETGDNPWIAAEIVKDSVGGLNDTEFVFNPFSRAKFGQNSRLNTDTLQLKIKGYNAEKKIIPSLIAQADIEGRKQDTGKTLELLAASKLRLDTLRAAVARGQSVPAEAIARATAEDALLRTQIGAISSANTNAVIPKLPSNAANVKANQEAAAKLQEQRERQAAKLQEQRERQAAEFAKSLAKFKAVNAPDELTAFDLNTD